MELMPEAVATRAANGMETVYNDVWEGLTGNLPVPEHDILIASPPCQTFSSAGSGAGRRALDEVIEAIRLDAYKDPQKLLEFGDRHDMRTALVLTPLAHVWRDRPKVVVLEQVPTVLPVWEVYAEVMRGWGYSVAVEVLHAEQFGVPQTRKRAILIARLQGVAEMPTPTHSHYYSRDPKRLDESVLPWVSMAEALRWGFVDRPALTVTGHGFLTRHPTGQQRAVFAAVAGSTFTFRPPFAAPDAEKNPNEPISLSRRFHGGAVNVNIEEAAVLQSYPTDPPFIWCGTKTKVFLQIGNAVPPLLAQAILEAAVPEVIL